MQNEQLLERLLETDNAMLVEASPYDRVWGVGLGADDPRILDPKQWQGQNLLGRCLEQSRNWLQECFALREKETEEEYSILLA